MRMPRDLKLEQHIYDIMTSSLALKYWVQTNGSLGTLGEARGIQLPPNAWTGNSPSIEIVYNTLTQQKAFIDDYYEIGLPVGAGAAENIQWKFNATTAHVENATMLSFASSEHDEDVPPETPRIMARGNGTATPGVNQKLLPWLQVRKGKPFKFRIIMPGLVKAVIGL
ncbi:hypothetical protein B0H14DRAFT_2723739 [Mycena olivaceomarginata]|nr:hypothetical protein B0H14DRAFT_2723739 [Mycena olivaceomarginata]